MNENENSSAYHAKLQRILDAQSKITEINKARQADGEEKRVNKEDNDPQLLGAAKSAMHDMLDMIVNHSSHQLGLEERVTMLNAKGVYLTQFRVRAAINSDFVRIFGFSQMLMRYSDGFSNLGRNIRIFSLALNFLC